MKHPSSSEPRYLTPADVHLRLSNTIIMYKGRPCYVTCIPDSLDIDIHFLPHPMREKERISANSTDLDIKSIELGYMEACKAHPEPLFLCRIPYRRQLQGLSNNNVTAVKSRNQTMGVNTDILTSSQAMKMMMNNYETYEACLDMIQAGVKGMPFDKFFCLMKKDNGIVLEYKAEPIGIFNPSTNVFDLTGRYNNSLITMKLAELGVRWF